MQAINHQSAARRQCLRVVMRIGLSVAATGMTLAAAEGLLKATGVALEGVAFRSITGEAEAQGIIRDSKLFWALDHRQNPSKFNVLGLRGPAPSGERGPRDLRIACVGDSCTYGLHATLEQCNGVRLERALQNRLPGARVETLLAAVPGYSTHQSRVLFDRHVRRWAPDVTVLYVGAWNDMVPAMGASDAEFAEEERLRMEHPFWSLRIGRLLRQAFCRWPSPEVEDLRRGVGRWGTRVPLPQFQENIEALILRASETGTVVAVTPPVETEGQRAWPWWADYRKALLETYRKHALTVVDGATAFEEHRAKNAGALGGNRGDRSPYMADGIHPSALGRPSGSRRGLGTSGVRRCRRTRCRTGTPRTSSCHHDHRDPAGPGQPRI